MNGFLAVALGGALGASLRHGVGLLSLRHMSQGWPWGTFTVNILGGLAMGLLAGWLAQRRRRRPEPAPFLATGVLGSFTTFSAFSLEVMNFIRAGETGKAAAYAGLSVLLACAALALGLILARKLFA